MGQFNVGSATASDLTNVLEDVTVEAKSTDGATGQEETEWLNSRWTLQFGYYNSIAALKKAIDMKAIWTIGKGFKANAEDTVILDHISGYGIDTFNSILKNMIITRQIAGDAFCEIIRDKETGTLVNLKPLDPGSIKIIVNREGIIKRYEQINKLGKAGQSKITFQPNEIFHLTKDRVADQIHGSSIVDAVQWVIDARYECMVDQKKLLHRNIKPLIFFKLDTDDSARIAAFQAKMDSCINKGENIYIPKDTVDFEIMSVSSNATLNPLPWIDDLNSEFFRAVGIPAIILGESKEFTESTAKIAYLAFQQSVEDEQMDIENQVWNQLQLRIELDFPASLENELLSDTNKDGANQQTGFQPSDTTAGVGK